MTLGYHGPAGLDGCTINSPRRGRGDSRKRLRPRRGSFRIPVRCGSVASSESHPSEAIVSTSGYTKRAIPQATRRAVALAAGAIPGETVPASCHYCGKPGRIYWPRLHGDGRPGSWVHFSGLELDHVTPERAGGPSTPENIVLACPRCNRSRGHRHVLPPRTGVA